ncbi:MAG: hypothetical protein IPM60_12230 [Rhodospirillales bacterium]|nr:hypothetical protein [Rhodospirillales bacterium]
MEKLIITYGPLLAAVISGIFTVATPFVATGGSAKANFVIRVCISLVVITALAVGVFIFNSYWEPKDAWSVWSENIKVQIDNCTMGQENKEAQCVKEAIKKHKNNIPPIAFHKTIANEFYHDIRTGSTLINIPEVERVFNKYFGINSNTFIGSGSTVPWTHTPQYKNADAREYLAPNLPETHKFVWTWTLRREEEDLKHQTVRQFITHRPPEEESDSHSLGNFLVQLEAKRIDIVSQPPVIRFQQFSSSKYQGTMGRPESFRVFCVSLQDVWDMSIEDAIKASGFTWDPQNSFEPDETLFIWLYVPFHDAEVVPATWGNVISPSYS